MTSRLVKRPPHVRSEREVLSSLRLLVEKDPFYDFNQFNKKGKTILMVAAKNGHREVVQFIINYCEGRHRQYDSLHPSEKKGPPPPVLDVGATTPSGFSALRYAIRSGFASIVKLLLSQGADIEFLLKDPKKHPFVYANNLIFFPIDSISREAVIRALFEGSQQYCSNLLKVLMDSEGMKASHIPGDVVTIVVEYVGQIGEEMIRR